MNDDDDLGIDLDTWQAPPVPAGLADRVLARMREEQPREVPQALPVEPERASRTRWWISGGALVTAATVAVIAFGLTRAPANGAGQLVATRPAHLALGPTAADLDARTVVAWRRAAHRITAQQAGGTAQWRVGGDDTLTIETALGSIEAINATLRVEVKMLDGTKTIALSAITAAAVAAVTIVVYEGSVRVREDTATHVVMPGTAYQIKAKGDNVIEVEAPVVGAAPVRDASVAHALPGWPGRLAGLGRTEIEAGIEPVRMRIRACGRGYDGKVNASLVIGPDGRVSSVTMSPPARPNTCIANILKKVVFEPTEHGGSIRYPFVFPAPSCDSDQLLSEGTEALVHQDLARARDLFQEAYACKPGTDTLKRVVLVACKMKDLPRARALWKVADEGMRSFMLTVCANNGVSLEVLEAE